jgi:hypothetical protein
MARRYPEARLVRQFTNGFGLTYREYADAAGNRTSVCMNPLIGRDKTARECDIAARRTLARMRREHRR